MSQSSSNGGTSAAGDPQIRESATLEIVSLVAETKGCRPWELRPLSRVTDPDAIENLLKASSSASFEISFDYEGGRVTVTPDGGIDYEFSGESPT
ncbi:HalOD1 output domain-containing protein [Halogeometricum luteum]|uniref:Halobacterial output domain-containing protein n=1 Tax=Halogeometricum luteum TaxID=2950537 RepID=A0ABU2G4B2_9EURY|nr:HalOD1 output domain-containing protein [Halogeometricum sp. S3BR5-2]MDS0295631.1 hypothetical protein [Halogeometricum sp. S3BR5-2]